jgi:predicted GNAT superfamily acetyltransferase
MESDFGSAAGGSPSGGEDIEDLKRDVSEEDTRQLNVEVPVSLHRRLKIHSIESGREMKEIVQDVLDQYLGD